MTYVFTTPTLNNRVEVKVYTKAIKPDKNLQQFSPFKKPKILGILLFLILLSGTVLGVYVSKQQQEIRQRADTGWNQCQVGENGNINTPCGSCSISIPAAGDVSFGCELDCGGFASGCPGNTAGDYIIYSAQMRCKNQGAEPCTENSPDFIDSADLTGEGPWTIQGQSSVNGSANFTAPQCGRVQVDVQMRETGTAPAGAVFDTGADCEQPTSTPTLTPAPTSAPTSTTAPTRSPTLTLTPTITPTTCPNIGEVQNVKIECPFCSSQ